MVNDKEREREDSQLFHNLGLSALYVLNVARAESMHDARLKISTRPSRGYV